MECGVKRLLVGLDFVYLRNICLFGYILQTFVLLCLGLCVRVWNILLNVCVDESKFCLSPGNIL